MSVFLRSCLLLITCLSLLSCSEDDPKVSDVDIEFTPELPVVINADFKLVFGTGDEVVEFEVPGPWFKTSMRVNNNTNSKLVIVGISGTVTAFDSLGNQSESDFEIGVGDLADPDATNPTFASNPLVALAIAQARTAGNAAAVRLSDVLTDGLVTTGGTDYYVSELPESEGNLAPISSYTIRAEVQGWFGEFDQANKAFNKIVFFSARR